MTTYIPRHLAILKFLTAHFEGINPEAVDPISGEPYGIDLRGKVFRGRTQIGAELQGPMLAFNEAPTPSPAFFADDGSTKKKEDWKLLLQGFAARDDENPSDPAYYLKALVEQRASRLLEERQGKPVYPAENFHAKFKAKLLVHQGIVRPPAKEVSNTAFFYIPLTIGMGTDITNPYVEEN